MDLQNILESTYENLRQLLDSDEEVRKRFDEIRGLLRPDPNFNEPDPPLEDDDDVDALFAWMNWYNRKVGVTDEYIDAFMLFVREIAHRKSPTLNRSGDGMAGN